MHSTDELEDPDGAERWLDKQTKPREAGLADVTHDTASGRLLWGNDVLQGALQYIQRRDNQAKPTQHPHRVSIEAEVRKATMQAGMQVCVCLRACEHVCTRARM